MLNIVLALCAGGCTRIPPAPPADSRVDAQLARLIDGIRAFDDHAHPVRPVGAGEEADTLYDALPVESLEAASDPVRMRMGAADTVAARLALFPEGKSAALARHGMEHAVWVLDQLGIETMVANRVAMGPGLPASRFLWAAYADALMYPFDAAPVIHNSDQKAFFALEEKLLQRYYYESGIAARPATLDEYLERVVRATLARHRQGGAIAEKFEIAYLRPYDIGNPSRAEAERAWRTLLEPRTTLNPAVRSDGASNYQALQDYIFRFIAAECGRLGMAVHIHTGAGSGGYFVVNGSNPLLLEPLLDDPALRQTKFVMLHGGWPFTRELTGLLTKPNAYVDFSVQGLITEPGALAAVLRAWLEYVPEKVLFGTDAYPYSEELGWEESGYIAAHAGRDALGIALTGMMADGEISRARAAELARLVLRDNARRLYGLK
ncbi:MAG TPA: amidohydrolase family protein [Bryobacteraceae bacterium]|nr:amidohydrolase family protein [Bryobacteraceae bacterium]